MWMASVIADAPPRPRPSSGRAGPHIAASRRQVLYDTQFRHMLPTPATLRAQDGIKPLQGHDGIWFAGGYLYPYDSQETALRSALRVALGLRGRIGAEPAADGSLERSRQLVPGSGVEGGRYEPSR